MPAENGGKRRTEEALIRPSLLGPVHIDAFSWLIGAL
jgi:hypothetical protein